MQATIKSGESWSLYLYSVNYVWKGKEMNVRWAKQNVEDGLELYELCELCEFASWNTGES